MSDVLLFKIPENTLATEAKQDDIISAMNSLPTEGNNPSLTLEYTGDNLTKLIKTIDGTDYEKTLSYTGSNLTGVSAWTEV